MNPPCPRSLWEGRPPEQAVRTLTLSAWSPAGAGPAASLNSARGTAPCSLSGDRTAVLLSCSFQGLAACAVSLMAEAVGMLWPAGMEGHLARDTDQRGKVLK